MARFIKSTVGALIAANAVMFVVLLSVTASFGAGAASWIGFAPDFWLRPWTLLTYMFTNSSASSLLFNCLFLWLFSRLALEIGPERRLLAGYLAGGLGGAMFFAAASALGLCNGQILFGSSAAVIGIVCYSAARVPYMSVNLMFFGPVKYMWVAIITVGLSLFTAATGNFGGAIAHIGGACAGVIYALSLRRRRGKYTIIRPSEKKTLDELLDKVKRSGYASLTPSERRQLLEYSQKL